MRTLARSLLPLALLATAAALAGPAGVRAAEKSDPVTTKMRADPLLLKPVTRSDRDRPLGELLPQIGQALGVTLRAASDVADDKATLLVQEKPAGETLLLLAEQLDFQWTRKGEAYELTQDDAAQRREQLQREKALGAQLQAIQDRMSRIGQMAGMPADRLDARMKEIQGQLGGGGLDPAQRAALMEEQGVLQDLRRPGAGPALALYRSLNPVQIQQLRTGQELRFSTENGTLPPQLAQQIHQAAADMLKGGLVLRAGNAPAGVPLPSDNAPPNLAGAIIRLGDSPIRMFRPGASADTGISLTFTMTSGRSDGPARNVFPVLWSPMFLPNQVAPPPPTETNDPDLRQEVDLTPLTKAAGPGGGPGEELRLIAGGPGGTVPLSRVLQLLHETTRLGFVSDSFIRGRVRVGSITGKRPLVQVLDRLAADLDYGWEKEGKLVRLRDGVYFQDRPAEVPERLMKSWRETLARNGRFVLDDLGDMATRLTDPRLRGLQNYWSAYLEQPGLLVPEAPSSLFANRQHLRLWGALLPQQRKAALAGIVPVRNMSPAQRTAFATALTSQDGRMPIAPPQAEMAPAPADILAGGFTLKTSQSEMRSYSSDGPNGGRMMIRTLGVGNRPGGPPPNVTLPDGGALSALELVASTPLDVYTFQYHLAGNANPARGVMVEVPQPAVKASAPPKG